MFKSIFNNLRSLFLIFGVALLSLINPHLAYAQTTTVFNPAVSNPEEGQVVLPRFLAGDSVIIDEAHAGTVFAVGSSVNVNAPIGGDLVVAGASVIINAPVNQDIYAAGASVIINAPVEGNVVVAGSEVQLLDEALVKGSVISAGQSMQLLGQIQGQLLSAGEREFIAGQVNSDVLYAGRELTIDSKATVGGNLRAQLQNDAISEQASIAGVVDIQKDPKQYDRWQNELKAVKPAVSVAGALYSFVWKTILLAMLVFFVPQLVTAGTKTLQKQGALAVMTGMITLVGVPILAVLAMLTVIAAPISLLVLGFYVWLMFVAWIFPTMWIGTKILPGQNKYLQAMLGVAVLVALSMIPILGMLFKLIMVTVGLGTVVLLIKQANQS